jgi:hypothetical protein
MYGTVYSTRTPVLKHHTQLYFAIESDRRTLIMILMQYAVSIYLSMYLSIDTCTVHSYSLMSCYSTDTDTVIDTDTDAACKLSHIMHTML